MYFRILNKILRFVEEPDMHEVNVCELMTDLSIYNFLSYH